VGARRAGEIGAEWLLFLDADTWVHPRTRAACETRARPGQFAIGDRAWPGPRWRQHLRGVLLVARCDFERLGGYDEAFCDYGPGDLELRCRLGLAGGARCVDLPSFLFDSIPHGDCLRSEHATDRDLLRCYRRNEELLIERIRRWTGKEPAAVPEIADLL